MAVPKERKEWTFQPAQKLYTYYLVYQAAPGLFVKQNHSSRKFCLRSIDYEAKKIILYCDYTYIHLVNRKSGKQKICTLF